MRARLKPCSPMGVTTPHTTSSIAAGSSFALLASSVRTRARRTSPRVFERAPLPAFPTPTALRTASTMNASAMALPLSMKIATDGRKTESLSQLRESAAAERRLEEVIDALQELRGARVGRRSQRSLDLVQCLELAEELHVAEPSPAREHLSYAIDLARQCLDADPGGTHAVRVGMVSEVRLEHRGDDGFEDRRLILVVPDVLQDEKIACVRLAPSVQKRTGREELQELHHTPVGQNDPLGADLEDEPLVSREELLAKAHPLTEVLVQLGELPRARERRKLGPG